MDSIRTLVAISLFPAYILSLNNISVLLILKIRHSCYFVSCLFGFTYIYAMYLLTIPSYISGISLLG